MKETDYIIFGARDWDNDWITQHRLVKSLSNNGHRVLFIENTGIRSAKFSDFPRIFQRIKNWYASSAGFRKLEKNISIFSPIIIPFPYSKIAKNINSLFFNRILRYWINKNRFSNIVYITFLATPLVNDFIEDSNSILKIYYSSDNHETASKNKNFLSLELNIVETSNLVFTTSQKLYEKFQDYNKDIYKIPAGVELDKFQITKNYSVPNDLKDIPKPIVGFAGGLNDKIDIDLLLKTTKRLNNYSFVIIGEVNNEIEQKLSLISNIYILGKKKHENLSKYIQSFDCGIMPYKVNEFTDSVYPSKLNEYLAMGKPVVSSNIYEMSYFNKENQNIVDIAIDENDFSNLIQNNIENDNIEKLKKRNLIASNNSWELRYAKISNYIYELIKIKKNENINWEKNFINEYKKLRKKASRYFLILSSLFFIFFISPLPYYVGETLVINDTPNKSDVIIGLSGYGQAAYINNSYQQRALDVYYYYNKRMGEKIILSGRRQLVEEFDLMKALLVSLGIPEKNIVLLKKPSSSTMENLENIVELMNKYDLKSANIISGSYHQKRVKMILNKIGNDKKFNLLAETNNQSESTWFFGYSKLKVIVYEFFSIIYNWSKF